MAKNPCPYFQNRVIIIQNTIRQYRVRFYELLKDRLNSLGIELKIFYGTPDYYEAMKGDSVDLTWGEKVNVRSLKFGSKIVLWHSCLSKLEKSDLVIVEQASKLLENYILFLQHIFGRRKLAFWGHGKNMHSPRPSLIGECLKRVMSCHVHWWFAYNDMSANIVREFGFPTDRITCVQNSIDTKQLKEFRASLTNNQINRIRQELGLKGNNVCIFIGSMYADKGLDFLIKACKIIRSQVADFEILFVGSGPELPLIEKTALKHHWIHSVGPKFDEKKVPYLALSKLLLLPSMVGLAILDSFALGVPLVTIGTKHHGPEIAYLINGFNGIKLSANTNIDEYAATVVDLLTNDLEREKIVKGCKQSSNYFSVEAMVERFAGGIKAALIR